MHEMGIILEIIDIVQASLPAGSINGDVRGIRLKVGKLSAAVPASLRFCFDVAAKEAGLDKAELLIEEVPVQANCKDCANTWTIETPAFICPACNSARVELISGRELDIESIEIAENDQPHADHTS